MYTQKGMDYYPLEISLKNLKLNMFKSIFLAVFTFALFIFLFCVNIYMFLHFFWLIVGHSDVPGADDIPGGALFATTPIWAGFSFFLSAYVSFLLYKKIRKIT